MTNIEVQPHKLFLFVKEMWYPPTYSVPNYAEQQYEHTYYDMTMYYLIWYVIHRIHNYIIRI